MATATIPGSVPSRTSNRLAVGHDVATWPPMQEALDDLVTLLDLEAIEVNLFRGRSPDENRQRVFGGQVAGQALVAAARTVDDPTASCTRCTPTSCAPATRRCRSSTRSTASATARSFTTRRVVAHPARPGDLQPAGQLPRRTRTGPTTRSTMPDGLPDPESLPDFKTRMAPYKEQHGRVVRPAAPDRPALRRRRSDQPHRATRSRASRSGCGPTARCPTTRRCTRASSPTRAT